MQLNRSCGIVAVALVVLAGPAVQPLFAQSLKEQLDGAVKQLNGLMRQHKVELIAVNEFNGSDTYTRGTGGHVQARLIEVLRENKIEINEKAPLRVSGEYAVKLEEQGTNLVLPEFIEIEFEFTVKLGTKKVSEFKKTIGYKRGGNEDILAVLGRMLSLTGVQNADPDERNKAIGERLRQDKPAAVAGTRIRCDDKSPYSLEILAGPVGKTQQARKVFEENNLPHVNLDKGEEYVVRIHNESAAIIAVNVATDGVDCYQFFQPSEKRPGALLILPKKFADVRGFRISLQKERAFLVGSILDSAAFQDPKLKEELAKIGDYKGLAGSSSLGLIKVTVRPFLEKGKEATRPRDIGTGIGRELDSPAKTVEGSVGAVLETIVVRYKKK